MTERHLFLAMTNPRVGMDEEEFNRFYDEIHVPDVIGAPGWVAAQRYRLCSEQRFDQDPPWRYMAVYEVELPAGEIMAALEQRPDIGPIGRPEPRPYADDDQVWIYTPIGPYQENRP